MEGGGGARRPFGGRLRFLKGAMKKGEDISSPFFLALFLLNLSRHRRMSNGHNATVHVQGNHKWVVNTIWYADYKLQ